MAPEPATPHPARVGATAPAAAALGRRRRNAAGAAGRIPRLARQPAGKPRRLAPGRETAGDRRAGLRGAASHRPTARLRPRLSPSRRYQGHSQCRGKGVMSTTGRTGDRHIPLLSSSHELVAMIRKVDLRISSGPRPAVPHSQAAHMTAPKPAARPSIFSLAPQGPSTHDNIVIGTMGARTDAVWLFRPIAVRGRVYRASALP